MGICSSNPEDVWRRRAEKEWEESQLRLKERDERLMATMEEYDRQAPILHRQYLEYCREKSHRLSAWQAATGTQCTPEMWAEASPAQWRERAYCSLAEKGAPPRTVQYAHWRTRHVGLTPLGALPEPYAMVRTPADGGGSGSGFLLAGLPAGAALEDGSALARTVAVVAADLARAVQASRPDTIGVAASVQDALGNDTLPLVLACLYAPPDACRELVAAATTRRCAPPTRSAARHSMPRPREGASRCAAC